MAIPRLLEEYGDRIYAMGLHMCETPQDAEDMVQEAFVRAWNKEAKPFIWYATAESIFEKLGRLCEKISGTGH